MRATPARVVADSSTALQQVCQGWRRCCVHGAGQSLTNPWCHILQHGVNQVNLDLRRATDLRQSERFTSVLEEIRRLRQVRGVATRVSLAADDVHAAVGRDAISQGLAHVLSRVARARR